MLQEQWADRFFFNQFDLQRNEKILDIGSGDGRNTHKIALLVPFGEVIGFDKSNSMIQIAREKNNLLDNLTYELGDVQNPAFFRKHKNYFDVVTSFVTLHWVSNQSKALGNIYTTLKPGGHAYLSLCSKNFDPIQEIADRKVKDSAWASVFRGFKDPMHRFSIEEYTSLCEKNNFNVIDIQEVRYADIIKSQKDLRKQIKSWLPHYTYLLEKRSPRADLFLNQVVDEYVAHYFPSENGRITLIDHYLHVILQKPNAS